MRIVMVTDQYAPMVGGVPAVTQSLARGLARRGHSVTLLAPSPAGPGRRDTADRVTLDLRRSIPWPWYEGMRLACVRPPSVLALMSDFAPDIAHIHSPLPLGVMARTSALRLRIPVVYTNHYLPENARPAGDRSRAFDGGFYRYLVGFGNRCGYVTAPTSVALGLLRDHGLRAPSRVISNGVDLTVFRPGPADEGLRERYGLRPGHPVILAVGRLSPEKNVSVLLEAAARLTTPADLVIAGTGPEAGRLLTAARRLGLGDRVRFLGFVPDPDLAALYRLADIFAIASAAELQSLATMEAMATGLPIVAANAYALRELVSHGGNGYLAAPGRASEMAGYLDQLLRDSDLRGAMAAASLRAIAGHEQDHSLAEWESLYSRLAADRPDDQKDWSNR